MTDQQPGVHFSIVIPVFQAEEVLEELEHRVSLSVLKITEDYELLLIDDGSTDRSWDVITELAARNPRVRGVRFSRNFGQHYALTAGMDLARGEWVAWMDCDLQDSPETLPLLYDEAAKGADVVLARRIPGKQTRYERVVSALFYRVFDFMAGTKTDPYVGTLRVLSRRATKIFREFRETSRFVGGVVQWMGLSTRVVEIPRMPRQSGRSTYSLKKKFDLALTAMLTFSQKPLTLAVKFGFLVSLVSFFFAAYQAYRKVFQGISVEGWASVIVSIYLLAGLIIMVVGVVGLYVGRVYEEVKGRPLYIVAESTFEP